jgi:hypothetical protein
MRTRQKLTAVGAIALATSAVGGGAVATSHAMSDSPTPAKGTMTVISMTGSDGAIKCVYDDIDLPTLAVGTGVPGQAGSPIQVSGEAISVISGTGPVDANGKPIAGTVTVSSGSAIGPLTEASTTEAGTAAAGSGETTQIGSVPPGLPVGAPIAIDSADARPGTAEECAALKPTTLPAPPAAP